MPGSHAPAVDSLLRDLLGDAKRIASYGQRSGRLKHAALFTAIQNAESKRRLAWSDAEATQLQLALASAAEEIRPVTLVDLRSGWDPFRKVPALLMREMISRAFFIQFAISLMAFSIYYTQWQKDAEHVVSLHEQGANQRQEDIIAETYEIYIASSPEDVRVAFDDLAGPHRTELRKNIFEIQSLQQKITNNTKKYNAAIDGADIVKTAYAQVEAGWRHFFPPGGEQGDAGKAEAIEGADLVKTAYMQVEAVWRRLFPLGGEQDDAAAEPPWNHYRTCLESYERDTPALGEGLPLPGNILITADVSESIMFDQAGLNLVRCVSGAAPTKSVRTYDERNLNGRIELVSLWLLPCLFGMLGAVIFHLRACLNRLRPDPSFGRALMRTFLGGFGGVAFGWFWSPDTTGDLIATTLPLGAYAIAFLIGYSIDVFYAMLDKLVVLVSGAIENIGRKDQPTTT